MSEEKARHVEGGLQASREQELSDENARLRAENSTLKERLTQAEKKLEQTSTLQNETGRKRRWNALDGEQQRASHDEDGATTDAKHGQQQAREDKEQERALTVRNITQLPSVVLGHALKYLTFLETRLFFGCGNRVLWDEKRVDYDSEMTRDLVVPARPPYTFLRSDLTNVCSLDLGPWCSNTVLALLCDERVLPNLEHLAMARSIDITDEGLALLSTNPTRRRKLKSLDIQFCRRISLEQTLYIRDNFEALDVLRRQPPWFDGLVVGNSVDGVVYKTYESWADGTYVIWNEDGSMGESGYFCDLYESGSVDCVVCKTQFVFSDEEWWDSQPDWKLYANRVGNKRLRLPDGLILEANPRKGIYPTNIFPRAEHANSVPVGEFKYFDGQGDECDGDHPEVYVRLEKYRLQPLNVLMPPPKVIALCRTQLNNMRRVMAQRDQEHDERELHALEGGDENDEPPPEWFQYYP